MDAGIERGLMLSSRSLRLQPSTPVHRKATETPTSSVSSACGHAFIVANMAFLRTSSHLLKQMSTALLVDPS